MIDPNVPPSQPHSRAASMEIAQAQTQRFRPVGGTVDLQEILRSAFERISVDVSTSTLSMKVELAEEYVRAHSYRLLAKQVASEHCVFAADIEVARNSLETRCLWLASVTEAAGSEIPDILIQFAGQFGASLVLAIPLSQDLKPGWAQPLERLPYTVEELPQSVLSQIAMARFWDNFVGEYYYTIKRYADSVNSILGQFGLSSDELFAIARRVDL